MDLTLTLLGLILVILLGISIGLITYATWNYGTLESVGIPVVKPFLFLGSNFKGSYLDLQELDIQRQRKYGDIYGVYDGRRPQVFVSDPKLIRRITTVDFDHFTNHGWIFGGDSESIFANILDVLKDEKWKEVRGAVKTIFTSGKIRQLTQITQNIGETYAEALLAQCSAAGNRINGVEFKEFVAPMVIEILSKCFCGVELPELENERAELVRQMKLALMHEVPQEDWTTVIPKIFPFVQKLFPTPIDSDGLTFFVSALKNILETREKSGEVGMDATATLVAMMKKVRSDSTYQRLGITETVVIAQGWEFFLSGYVGLRDVFDFFMYEMARNPAIQKQLFAEIKSQEIDDSDLTNVNLKALPLLEACVLEVTRLHPTFIRPERICNQDWKFEGIQIPNGTQVIFSLPAVHMNPTHYPNPETFDPWRFMGRAKKERDPYTFLTFGHGPRGCLGQAFAIECIKVLVSSFLLRFKMIERPDTVCERTPGKNVLLTFKPLKLDVVKR